MRLEIEKGGEKAAEHLAEEMRVPSERGVAWWGGVDSLRK